MMGGKNVGPLNLVRRLNISNHMRSTNQEHNNEYRLCSTINHKGTSSKQGHYTSYCQAANGVFYHFDDVTVNQTSLYNVLNEGSSSAYILFYEQEKRNSPPGDPRVMASESSLHTSERYQSTSPSASKSKRIGQVTKERPVESSDPSESIRGKEKVTNDVPDKVIDESTCMMPLHDKDTTESVSASEPLQGKLNVCDSLFSTDLSANPMSLSDDGPLSSDQRKSMPESALGVPASIKNGMSLANYKRQNPGQVMLLPDFFFHN